MLYTFENAYITIDIIASNFSIINIIIIILYMSAFVHRLRTRWTVRTRRRRRPNAKRRKSRELKKSSEEDDQSDSKSKLIESN